MIANTIPKIDLSALRVSQNFLALGGGSQKLVTTIPVRKPDKQEFARVRSEDEFKFPTFLLEYKEDRSMYLVDRAVWEYLGDLVAPKLLVTAMSRQGVLFLWPIKLPGADGRSDRWSESALMAAKQAETDWVRVASNMSLGGYEVFKATASLPEPEWPELTMDQIINIAFRDRYITTPDHDVIKRLRGEI